jgi:hypothetical protein
MLTNSCPHIARRCGPSNIAVLSVWADRSMAVPTCHEFQYSYHSCRNRHCPKCQHELTQNWLELQQEILLPVPYFFLTFTLPSELRNLVRSNQKALYSLLFQSSAEAAQKLARDPRYIGGRASHLDTQFDLSSTRSLSRPRWRLAFRWADLAACARSVKIVSGCLQVRSAEIETL